MFLPGRRELIWLAGMLYSGMSKTIKSMYRTVQQEREWQAENLLSINLLIYCVYYNAYILLCQ